MGDQGTNAILALILGSLVAVLLFIPVAAVQYRRDGRLGPADLAVLVAAAVYGVALWTYTLLPLPDVGDYACQHAQTQLMAFAGDIRRAAARSGYAGLGTPGELLRNRAFLQVVLNVLLFVPLGVLVRADHPSRRGGRHRPRLRGLPAHRGHPAHGSVGRLPVRLPALRRRRPAHQHPGRAARRRTLLPVRRPPAPPSRHRPPVAAHHGLGRSPAGRHPERRAVRGAGRHRRGGTLAVVAGLRGARPAADGRAGAGGAARRRTSVGRGCARAACRQDDRGAGGRPADRAGVDVATPREARRRRGPAGDAGRCRHTLSPSWRWASSRWCRSRAPS